ncbi:helix-turn-helix domain-containing protein [Saccharospirillum salsuginis]|uniref:helix-turn-helix domain-containing protein n=1 Tax=Saccharospirillum salsuginis TaxID=418750 RepID=UPI00167BE5B9|nr:AraC family transcriptional regulator [Saccharospirillum salsuginis]
MKMRLPYTVKYVTQDYLITTERLNDIAFLIVPIDGHVSVTIEPKGKLMTFSSDECVLINNTGNNVHVQTSSPAGVVIAYIDKDFLSERIFELITQSRARLLPRHGGEYVVSRNSRRLVTDLMYLTKNNAKNYLQLVAIMNIVTYKAISHVEPYSSLAIFMSKRSIEKQKVLHIAWNYIDYGQCMFANASKQGFTESSFKSLFYEIFLATPAKWLKDQKLQQSKELLCSSTLSIRNIAYELHFSDPSHFVRSFKKHYGVSPGEYRRAVTIN